MNVRYLNVRNRIIKRALGATLLIAVATAGLACAGYSIDHKVSRSYPRLLKPDQVKCWDEPIPARPRHVVVAVVSSSSATTSSLEVREAQLEQLKQAASRAGAEVVYNVRVETRQTRKMGSDERTPFPSLAQEWSDRYVLRGDAVLFEQNWPKDMKRYNPKPSGRKRPDAEE